MHTKDMSLSYLPPEHCIIMSLVPFPQKTERYGIFQAEKSNHERLIPGGFATEERLPKVTSLVVMEVY